MMDDAAHTIGTAIQQYIEKHLTPLLNKLNNASDNMQTATQTAREVTGEVNKAVEKATACEENEAYNAAANRGTYAAVRNYTSLRLTMGHKRIGTRCINLLVVCYDGVVWL